MARVKAIRPDLAATSDVAFLDLPPIRVIAVDGTGIPGSGGDWPRALQALYGTAFTLKFALKRGRGVDTTVSPLEGLWTVDTIAEWAAGEAVAAPTPQPAAPDLAKWRVQIALPPEASDAEVGAAIAAAAAKRPDGAYDRLVVEEFAEGAVAQVLHVGPYDAEQPTIARLHAAIAAAGRRFRGRHHEIYLSNPNLAAPERLKTIIRQPVE